ncbi:hypothetical protein [Reichenbachiella sp.]|uniref:hypothetical protein n=1 Tax=Reichenbachiella sp. TaxID=2184521 RepID=UPI00329983EB
METLVKAQNKFDQTMVTRNAAGAEVTDIVFSGYEVTLSDLVNKFPGSGGNTLAIYADKLTVDVPNFNALGTVVVARQIYISSLDGASWPVSVPDGTTPTVVEGLIMGSISKGKPVPLSFITSKTTGSNPAPLYQLPVNGSSLCPGTFMVHSDGTTQGVDGKASDFLDLVGRPWALNSLYASFESATSLINVGDQASLSDARDILHWICDAILGCGTVPDTHSELLAQASSLLVSINIPDNYHAVGPLSATYYSEQINGLISAISEYNDHLDELESKASSEQLIEKVSSAVVKTSATESTPVTTQYNQVTSMLSNLFDELLDLMGRFNRQITDADTKCKLLYAAIADQQVKTFLKESVETAIDAMDAAMSIAESVEKGGEGALGAAKDVVSTLDEGYDTIKGIAKSYDQDSLVNNAKVLLITTKQLLSNVFNSQQLWFQVNNPTSDTKGTTFNPVPVTIDPDLSWNNYMANVQHVLSNLSDELKDDKLEGAQPSSNAYLESLNKVANFGKAINTKVIAYSKVLCKAVVLKAKLTAIQNTANIWGDLKARAASEEEQINSLKGMINNRIDSTMRSVFVAWTAYRNAYYYNSLTEPVETITLETSVADLQAAFTTISGWVSGLKSGTTVLPSKGANLKLTIPVAQPNGQAASTSTSKLTAYLDASGQSISFDIPKALNPILSQLGANDVAIWITEAEFYLKGVKANDSGYVPLKVSTSGHYVNGDSADLVNFLSNSLSGHFSYEPSGNGEAGNINVPFNIDTANYMLPTPFTLWTIEASGGADLSEVTEVGLAMKVNLKYNS